jgi:hypothetical protein
MSYRVSRIACEDLDLEDAARSNRKSHKLKLLREIANPFKVCFKHALRQTSSFAAVLPRWLLRHRNPDDNGSSAALLKYLTHTIPRLQVTFRTQDQPELDANSKPCLVRINRPNIRFPSLI